MAELDVGENKSKIISAREDTLPTGVTHTGETLTCLFPGCERDAVPPPKVAVQGRTGPPPRYCELEEHNAASAFHEIKRLENEASEDA